MHVWTSKQVFRCALSVQVSDKCPNTCLDGCLDICWMSGYVSGCPDWCSDFYWCLKMSMQSSGEYPDMCMDVCVWMCVCTWNGHTPIIQTLVRMGVFTFTKCAAGCPDICPLPICMPSYLQKLSTFSASKFVPMSETVLLGSLYSERIILYLFIRLSELNPSICFLTEN